MKINKSTVDNLPLPEVQQEGKTAQKRYYDDNLKGFGVRITSGGSKAFFVEKFINRKRCRITLGHYPELTAEMARNKALLMLGQIAMGGDPIAEKKASTIIKVTLNEVFKDYLKTRKTLKPKTISNYQQILDKGFTSWKHKPILSITKDRITKYHEKLGKEHGEAYANLAMRILRALFNFAAGQYEDAKGNSLILENPVKRLSQTRAWYRVERRQTYIKPHELKAWYAGLQITQNEVLRDYLLLILLTGLRRQEAATLKWSDVDLSAKTFTLSKTKNNETHTLPLSDFLYNLMVNRKKNQMNDYVFPGTGAAGHIIEPRKLMAHVTKTSGVHFTVHDLRRTFITIAESLDIPAYALKRLMNHKMNNDVTAGYIVADVERLRKPMQLITNYILKCMEVIESAEIITIQATNKEQI
ncbi:TPA: tyrosine-type recombinase/integrase [Legionella pneumophila]|uniref:Integrase n=1 Tax=Legionella norrlandica TaxID=1498499 RepID=A0A0A2T429_9GAMM|nr:tyrosine-type recombinase/integrase [Legionella norrlandica]HAT3859885.1 tyrosine-type recombinase/integrase [Legionella pneumophila]KGP62183.1 integrase [Legionella norrlandica]HAT3884835.1 tyrosine-type recombinase/integrase [Legionella pneumophila]HAT8335493.1 tyrosine-type recombinase/integrase [Legionella pneumophila]HAU0971063.1 tyrosine-type recombinase/integrase [Legionella pneumophila]